MTGFLDLGGAGAGAGSSGYQIPRSLRFRSSAGAYLSRTPGVAGDQQKFTYSLWCKRGTMGYAAPLLGCGTSGAVGLISFSAQDQLTVTLDSGVATTVVSTSVYRDPSAWYHIVFSVDTTQATAANRCIVYVNGVQLTAFASTNYPAQNALSKFNQALNTQIGYSYATATYLDGYLAEVNFINGQALTPSSFGETSATTGQWQAKKYTGTYGTNGFYLPFSDTTSTTTLCYDASGNANHWTPTNISLTAGATYDSMTDVPLGGGGSLGNGQGNYAVSNILDIDRANISTSNGNLTLTKATASDSPRAASSIGATTGKWYCEVTWASLTDTAPNANYILTGVTTKEAWTTTSGGFNTIVYFAANAPGAGLAGYKQVITAGSLVNSAYGTNYFTNGSVIGIALDLGAGTVTFYNNNVSQGAITLPTTSEAWFPFCTSDGTSNGYTAHWNFGQRPFAYTPPTGFKALHTGNLSAPAVAKPNQHMDAITWTSLGATTAQTITGAQFQPDLLWLKSRSFAEGNTLVDAVRGSSKTLSSWSTAAEGTSTTFVTAFNSNGWSMGTTQFSAGAIVTWLWKANGAGSSNTNGTITSTVSVNPTAGFSVATFTTPASGNFTVGHGLGVSPAMVIVKDRNGGGFSWYTWHKSFSSATRSYVYVNGVAVVDNTSYNMWGAVGHTSSTLGFTVGTSTIASANQVAYCFAEVPGFSKFGSYTGNQSADGPFVFCGFRPRFIMIKSATLVSGSWVMIDTARDTYNVSGLRLDANATNAETDARPVLDVTANGFKIRSTGNDNWNASASQPVYIFAAFAEAPFQSALAR